MLSKGCVAVLDALGFKGIYDTVEPQRLLSAMEAARAETVRMLSLNRLASEREDWYRGVLGLGMLHHDAFKTTIQFVSDTVIIACCYKDPRICEIHDRVEPFHLEPIGDNEPLIAQTLQTVLQLTAFYIGEAVLSSIPLGYRGCLALGEMDIRSPANSVGVSGDFVIGPAVDEAAKFHQAWDGAYVVLDSRARQVFEERASSVEPGHIRCPLYPIVANVTVPISQRHKAGIASADRLCVIPFAMNMPESRTRLRDGFSVAFDRGVAAADVLSKRRNTVSFLDQCEQICSGRSGP